MEKKREMRRNERRAKGIESERADTMGTNVYSSKDNQSMHKALNGEFILYQILLEQILSGNKSLDKEELTLCEYFEPEETNDQKLMKEFDEEYRPPKAIYWYTKESPIYKILNKALRTQDIDDLIPFGQFIKDLYQQLSDEQKLFIKKQETSFLQVYRGQFISKDEVKRLKSSENQLISVNSFLSTSTNRKKALEFATSRAPPTDQLTSILLEITLNLNSITRPYADIKHLSAFPEEEEILLMFGSVFRIEKVQYDEKLKLWSATLTLASEDDEDYKEYEKSLKKELKGQNQFISIGNYFLQMQKYEDAQKHFEQIFQKKLVADPTELAYAYHGLAFVNQKKGYFRLAIENLEKGLDYLLKDPSKQDHPLLSQSYNDLAQNYFYLNDYLNAFQFYDKALKTKNNIASSTYEGLGQLHFQLANHLLALQYFRKALKEQDEKAYASIGNIYIQMGKVYISMNDKEQASEMFDKAIKSQLKFLPSNHPDIAYTYIGLSSLYSQINDKDKALNYLQKAYQLQLETLPENHLDFGQIYKHFGDFYKKYDDFDKALSYYHRALDNELKTLLWNHPTVAHAYFTIGSVHQKRKEYDQALIYFLKIVDSELTRAKDGDKSLTIAYENVANLYYDKEDFEQALVYYHKQLDNELNVKLTEDLSLSPLYRKIGDLYRRKGDLKQALLHYYRLLDCHFRKDQSNTEIVNEIYKLIGDVYLQKVDLSERLLLYEQVKIESDEDVENIYFEKKHIDEAVNYFSKSLQEQTKSGLENNQSINNNYQILGTVLYDKGNIDQSLDYFVKLLNNEIQLKGFTDSSLINHYKSVGKLCFEKQYFNEGLICFNRLIDCLRLEQKDHRLDINEAFKSIGNIYLKKDCFDQPSNYINRLIKKKSKKLDLMVFRSDFQFEEYHLNDNLTYFQYLLKKKSLRTDFNKQEIYWIVGNLCLEKENLDQSSSVFEKLLSYQHKKSSSNSSLAKTNEILANIYQKQSRFTLALQRFQEALFFYKQSSPTNQYLIDHLKYQIHLINSSNKSNLFF